MTLVRIRKSHRTPATEEDSAIELMRNVSEILEAETGLRGDLNRSLAAAIVSGLRKRFPTETIYIPSDRHITAAARNERMRAEWTGRNLAELSERYELGVRQVRRIVEPQKVTSFP
jgi:Mor family transcriptional regulator